MSCVCTLYVDKSFQFESLILSLRWKVTIIVSTSYNISKLPCLFPRKEDWKSNWMKKLSTGKTSVYPVDVPMVYSNLYGLRGPSIFTVISPFSNGSSVTVSEKTIVPRNEFSLMETKLAFRDIRLLHVSRLADVPPAQLQSVSTLQLASHPSPLSRFPSSHSTPPKLNPLPQISIH